MSSTFFDRTKQFSCILHAKNPDTAYDAYNEEVERIYQRIRSDISVQRCQDVVYDNKGVNTKIDIWGAENPKKVFIMIHGGYWLFGSRTKCLAVFNAASELGYTVVSIGYDFANTEHPVSECIEEVVRGVQHFVIGGHSAGAHLAFQAVTRISCEKIKGVCLISGIYQLDEFVHSDYGKEIGLTSEEAERCNCYFENLDCSKIPTLIMNCRFEAPKLYEQNVQFSKIVKNATYKEYANEDHFSILTNLKDAKTELFQDFTNFLNSL